MASRMLRPVIDMAMTVLLLLSMAYELVGPPFARLLEGTLGLSVDEYELGPVMHEWLGITLIALFFWHLWLNRYWLKNLFKGRYNATRAVLSAVNILLILDVAFLLASGLMMARSLPVIDVPGGMAFARTAHILASYWGYVIMSFHIGLYWHVMNAMMFRRSSSASPSPLRRALPHAAALVLMAFGLRALMKRQIGEYLFLVSEFVFFDFEEPIFYFFLDYIAVMILFACLGHYLILLFRRLKI
ncbi:MAG: DUF4405 domain-containing protein [Fretibacterium sp.]|nr:DUF4405 domain-containing protein [Fretibacterium sp.]